MTTGPREVQRALWPRGRRTVAVRPVAPRLDSLAGKTVGQLWDDLFRGDEIFPMLEAALGRKFPGVKFVGYRTFGSTHGATEQAVIASLAPRMREHGVDAVISGMAC